MKLHTLAVFAPVFIAACGSKPLTETECKTIASKEIVFVVSKALAGDAESFKAFLASKAEEGTAQCMAGKPTVAATMNAWSRRTTRTKLASASKE